MSYYILEDSQIVYEPISKSPKGWYWSTFCKSQWIDATSKISVYTNRGCTVLSFHGCCWTIRLHDELLLWAKQAIHFTYLEKDWRVSQGLVKRCVITSVPGGSGLQLQIPPEGIPPLPRHFSFYFSPVKPLSLFSPFSSRCLRGPLRYFIIPLTTPGCILCITRFLLSSSLSHIFHTPASFWLFLAGCFAAFLLVLVEKTKVVWMQAFPHFSLHRRSS